ncbi:MAG: response regulator [Candidatus Zixiibacteriota bacterium]
MQVLVVDDSQIMRKIIIGVLKRLNIKEIVEAADGQEAIEAVAANTDIGLILMDWNMPRMSGIDALKKLRADNVSAPIVMVTTEGEKQKVIEAIKAGANDFLIKPFTPKDITAKLEKFLPAGS